MRPGGPPDQRSITHSARNLLKITKVNSQIANQDDMG